MRLRCGYFASTQFWECFIPSHTQRVKTGYADHSVPISFQKKMLGTQMERCYKC